MKVTQLTMSTHHHNHHQPSDSRSSPEEMLSLLDEKTLSDLESDLDKAETERRFPRRPWPISKLSRSIRPSAIKHLLLRTGFTLLPSFVQLRIGKDRPKPDKLYPTSYLDGMRGLAALFVFFCHYSYNCFIITYGYGLKDPGQNFYFLQLPIIRLFYSGPPMVCLFFIISGYCLSLKPLKLMRSRSWENFYITMTSSIFRRGFRLFLPTIVSTFLIFLMLRIGLYEGTRAFANDSSILRNVLEFHPPRMATFGQQFADWSWQMFNFVHVFSWVPFSGSTNYDVHLWTLPAEYRASLMLFLTLVALSRLRSWLRLTTLFGIILFVLRNDRWEMMLFLSGMWIAEFDLIQQAKPKSLHSDSECSSPSSPTVPIRFSGIMSIPPLPKKHLLRPAFWITLSILALYLMSQPDQYFERTPGWIWLSSLIPEWFSEKYRFWQCIGSIFLVLAVSRNQLLQRPFNAPVVQYFGKISYALYLMHGPVMHVVGYRIEPWAWSITGTDPFGAYVAGFLLGSIFIVPLVIWVSDVFWRVVDAPSVKIARWLEAKVSIPAEETEKGLPR